MSVNPSDRFKNLAQSGRSLIDFGLQPVSNRFLAEGAPATAPHFPLALRIDAEDGLIHMAEPFPLDDLKPRYTWLTCFEPEAHLDDLVKRLIQLPGITSESVIGAYSFKDDTTLRRLENLGYVKTWRIDPAADLGVNDPMANVETYQKYFTPAQSEKMLATHGLSDIFIVRHVLEHSYALSAFMQACKAMVRPGGYVIFEVPDCARALDLGDFTTIWEEHVFYFTPFTLRNVLKKAGFKIEHFESVEYPFENSLVAITVVDGNSDVTHDAESVRIEVQRAENFATVFNKRRIAVRKILEDARRKYGPIAMFGAGHLSVAFLSLMEVSDLIEFVVDDNPNKKGMRMPVGNLAILGSQALYDHGIAVCLLSLNPQNQPKVVGIHRKFTESGGRFASIFPGSSEELEAVL